MKYFWVVIAGFCVFMAATFLWFQRTDLAFVLATLGVVAWFLNYRRRLKEMVEIERDTKIEDSLDGNDND